MRISHLILTVVALIGCAAGYYFGYHAGIKVSPLKEARQGDLLVALRTYQAAEATNWTKVHSTLGMQVLAMTRDYERKYGVPTGTNRFVQAFAEAKDVADRVESQLVPLGAALRNQPLAPGFKVRVDKQ